MKRLYGHERYVGLIVDKLSGSQKPVVFICGRTGTGKSTIATETHDEVFRNGYDTTYYAFEGDVQSYVEPFIRHLRSMVHCVGDRHVSCDDIIAALALSPENKLAKIISGALQDLSSKAGLDKTLSALGSVFEDSVSGLIDSIRSLADRNQDSFYTEYIGALRELAPLLPRKSVLILDQIEDASDKSWDFIRAVSKRIPSNVGLLLIVNDEKLSGISFIEKAMPTLQSLGVDPITIEGLTIEGLREWVENEKGVTLHDNILSRALLLSGGRPGPLRAWINNGVLTLDSLEAPDMNNYGFYRELFNRLEPESQYALRILGSLSYSMQVDVSMLANFMQIDERSVAIVIHELEQFRLIDRSGRIIRLNNRQFAEYLRSDLILPLPPHEIRNVLSIMEHHYGSIEPRHNTYSLVDTKKDLLMISTEFVDYDYLVDVAKRQYDDGAYRSARRIANEILTQDRLLSETHSYGFRIVSAQACDQLGLYDEGIANLSAVRYETLPVQDKTKYNIVLGKLYFRLNDYGSACACISRAESLTEETGDAESNAKCRIYRAHIHRDTEQYEAAYEVAIQLQRDLLTRVTPLTSAHIHRSTSRAMSSLADRGAIVEAQKSIEIAIAEYSKVDEGNGYFALGEAFRLNKEYDSSIPAYHKGLDIALALENKDLEIYCRLGLAASFLGVRDVDSASSHLRGLSMLSYDKFPIETLHVKLLSHVVGCLESPIKDRDSAEEFISVYEARYNRQATRRFVDSIHAIDTIPERFNFIIDNPIMF